MDASGSGSSSSSTTPSTSGLVKRQTLEERIQAVSLTGHQASHIRKSVAFQLHRAAMAVAPQWACSTTIANGSGCGGCRSGRGGCSASDWSDGRGGPVNAQRREPLAEFCSCCPR
jgi:hypothetical protein